MVAGGHSAVYSVVADCPSSYFSKYTTGKWNRTPPVYRYLNDEELLVPRRAERQQSRREAESAKMGTAVRGLERLHFAWVHKNADWEEANVGVGWDGCTLENGHQSAHRAETRTAYIA